VCSCLSCVTLSPGIHTIIHVHITDVRCLVVVVVLCPLSLVLLLSHQVKYSFSDDEDDDVDLLDESDADSPVKVCDHNLWPVVFSLLLWVGGCVAWWVSSSVKVMTMTVAHCLLVFLLLAHCVHLLLLVNGVVDRWGDGWIGGLVEAGIAGYFIITLQMPNTFS
jgi:hypothetical protein